MALDFDFDVYLVFFNAVIDQARNQAKKDEVSG